MRFIVTIISESLTALQNTPSISDVRARIVVKMGSETQKEVFK